LRLAGEVYRCAASGEDTARLIRWIAERLAARPSVAKRLDGLDAAASRRTVGNVVEWLGDATPAGRRGSQPLLQVGLRGSRAWHP